MMTEVRMCKKCGVEKSLSEMYSYKRNGTTRYRYQCMECRTEYNREWRDKNRESVNLAARKWRSKNPDKVSEHNGRYRKCNENYFTEYRENNRNSIEKYNKDYLNKNRELVYKRNDKWKKNNPEYHPKYQREWSRKNPEKCAAKSAKRRGRKLNATPSWLTREHNSQIEEVYCHAIDCRLVTGEEYHVDHIVPLQGRNVCGLHVPWNLQVLPADVNLSKGNKFPVDT